ncbi:cobalamin biosynthesis protein, partial [uncultured Phascolarctobacterium sp.]|uniref:cobalamin biosynthesis protein n=1 Tax=uncultured Phascolarctobacterium sp. TaxID=512296 RepID=UPI0025D31733
RRNTPLENIEALVLPQLEALGLDKRCVAGIASVDLKKDEQGLLAFARKYNFPAAFYTAGELNAVEGDFTPSSFVQSVVGVSNVCERSAVKDSGGRLLLRKTSLNGVTLAVAAEDLVLDFGHTGLKTK